VHEPQVGDGKGPRATEGLRLVEIGRWKALKVIDDIWAALGPVTGDDDERVDHLAAGKLVSGWILEHQEDRLEITVADPGYHARGAFRHRVANQKVEEVGIFAQHSRERSVGAGVAPFAEQKVDKEECRNIRVIERFGFVRL